MTKKPKKAGNATPNPKRWKSTISSKKFWVLIVMCVLGYVLFRQIEMRIQQAEFERAEVQILDEVTRLGRLTDTPANTKLTRQCYYMAREYGHGTRECRITAKSNYSGLSIAQANELMNKFATAYDGRISGEIKDTNPKLSGSSQIIYQRSSSYYLDYCNRNYQYDLEDRQHTGTGDFKLIIECGGSALAEYYPVVGE